MLCQKCQKNSANVNIVKNINGTILELHLCSDCAAAEKLQFPAFPTDELFSAFFKGFTSRPEAEELRCAGCGMTYRELKNHGKFGCSDCFQSFSGYLDGMLKSIHGNAVHTGKLPKKAAVSLQKKRALKELKEQLRKAIESEHFESAAQLRDQIRRMEKGEASHE